jgi:hypothetical protein
MSAAETWLVVAAIVAGVAAVLHLLSATPGASGALAILGRALTAAAIGLVAVGLVVALP